MQFDVITLFPEMLAGYCEASILGRAGAAGLISVRLHQLRDYAVGKHRVTDEPPYGGGGGMVLKPEPLFAAVEAVRGEDVAAPVILLTPQGRPFTQAVAAELSRQPRLILVAGRYEGVDERVRQHLVTDEISIGGRVEYLYGGSGDGAYSGLGAESLITVTPTLRYMPADGIIMTLEPRLEWANEEIFFTRTGNSALSVNILAGLTARIGN